MNMKRLLIALVQNQKIFANHSIYGLLELEILSINFEIGYLKFNIITNNSCPIEFIEYRENEVDDWMGDFGFPTKKEIKINKVKEILVFESQLNLLIFK